MDPRIKKYHSGTQMSRLIKRTASQIIGLAVDIVERAPDKQAALDRLRAFAGPVKEGSKENNTMTDAPHAPLCIEIRDPRNITVLVDGIPIGSITELKLHAASDKIPPVFEITFPEIPPNMDDTVKEAIGRSVEAVRKSGCGAQIHYKRMVEFQLESNPEEQTQAEKSLQEQLIPPKV